MKFPQNAWKGEGTKGMPVAAEDSGRLVKLEQWERSRAERKSVSWSKHCGDPRVSPTKKIFEVIYAKSFNIGLVHFWRPKRFNNGNGVPTRPPRNDRRPGTMRSRKLLPQQLRRHCVEIMFIVNDSYREYCCFDLGEGSGRRAATRHQFVGRPSDGNVGPRKRHFDAGNGDGGDHPWRWRGGQRQGAGVRRQGKAGIAGSLEVATLEGGAQHGRHRPLQHPQSPRQHHCRHRQRHVAGDVDDQRPLSNRRRDRRSTVRR